MRGDGWERFSMDLIIAGVLYLTWERIYDRTCGEERGVPEAS